MPELSFHLKISAQHICWVMNFISAQSLFDFEKTKERQPKPQKRIYYMNFSLIILDKERLKEVFCVAKEIGFDSSSVKGCRITNKFNAKNDINEVVRLAGSIQGFLKMPVWGL